MPLHHRVATVGLDQSVLLGLKYTEQGEVQHSLGPVLRSVKWGGRSCLLWIRQCQTDKIQLRTGSYACIMHGAMPMKELWACDLTRQVPPALGMHGQGQLHARIIRWSL